MGDTPLRDPTRETPMDDPPWGINGGELDLVNPRWRTHDLDTIWGILLWKPSLVDPQLVSSLGGNFFRDPAWGIFIG